MVRCLWEGRSGVDARAASLSTRGQPTQGQREIGTYIAVPLIPVPAAHVVLVRAPRNTVGVHASQDTPAVVPTSREEISLGKEQGKQTGWGQEWAG